MHKASLSPILGHTFGFSAEASAALEALLLALVLSAKTSALLKHMPHEVVSRGEDVSYRIFR